MVSSVSENLLVPALVLALALMLIPIPVQKEQDQALVPKVKEVLMES